MLTAEELEGMIQDTGGVRVRFTITPEDPEAEKLYTWAHDEVVDERILAMGFAAGIEAGQRTLVGVTEILEEVDLGEGVEVEVAEDTWHPFTIRSRPRENGGTLTRCEIIPA